MYVSSAREGALKIVQPPIIVSVCLETQRRIAGSRARVPLPDSAQKRPERAAADAAPQSSRGSHPDGT
jgi:hypothetical protein